MVALVTNGFTLIPTSTKQHYLRNAHDRQISSTHLLHSHCNPKNEFTTTTSSTTSSTTTIHQKSIKKIRTKPQTPILKGITSTLIITTLVLNIFSFLPQEDTQAYAATGTVEKEAIVWKSGKTPVIPGKKPKDKNDTSGTRKDGDFLRSISQCKVRGVYFQVLRCTSFIRISLLFSMNLYSS